MFLLALLSFEYPNTDCYSLCILPVSLQRGQAILAIDRMALKPNVVWKKPIERSIGRGCHKKFTIFKFIKYDTSLPKAPKRRRRFF